MVDQSADTTGVMPQDLKSLLAQENAVIRSAHFGGAGGSEVVQRRTALVDGALRDIHRRLEQSGPLPALVAVGGYGRGELNPHSDVDILILCRDETDRRRSPELLYPLWDAGLDLGYSVRTAKECTTLARKDLKIRTSLIESRLIAGDRVLYREFYRSLQEEVLSWKAETYIREKIAERDATRRKYGGSIYLREPNVKEGEGGLRDFHTALWIAFTHFRIGSFSELVSEGVLTAGQFAVIQRSRNFLWRVRNEMHYASERKNDHLTFDLQERTARDFRFRDSAHLAAVERFMKAYFLHARNIREFSNIVIAAVLPKPSRPWFSRTVPLGPFSLVGRTLIPSSDDICRGDPGLIMTAFATAQERHAALSDRLRTMIRGCRIDDTVRRSETASQSFRAILNNPDGLFETLTLMKDLRFLGRYLPEFRAIQALARHDYYHRYTVDEHILLAVRNLQNLWSGSYPALPSLVDAFKGLPKRWVLMLAVLLHDLGKARLRDHETAGVEFAAGILDRMGIGGEDRERILFLIRNHLVMSTLSQRRELTDRNVIADFAGLVKDRENLAMLYLLTYADIAAVNPGAWTQWKAVLLQDLFVRTLTFLERRGVAGEEDRQRVQANREKFRRAAAERYPPAETEAFLAAMSEQYLLATSTNKVLYHLDMVRRLPEEQLVIRHRHYPDRGYTELTVCAFDAYGMFHRAAGALASKNLNILRAQVYTSKDGVMLDTFQVTDAEGNLCDYEAAWSDVHRDLAAALTKKTRPPEPGRFAERRPTGPVVEPAVAFDNDASAAFTIIDITAADRVGFLYRVAKTLYDLNLDIGSAKITTEGPRAMDSFYVTDLLRAKITDPLRLEKIRETLLRVVE